MGLINALKKYGWGSYIEPTPTNAKLWIDAITIGLAFLTTTKFADASIILWVNVFLVTVGRFIKSKTEPEIKQLPDESK